MTSAAGENRASRSGDLSPSHLRPSSEASQTHDRCDAPRRGVRSARGSPAPQATRHRLPRRRVVPRRRDRRPRRVTRRPDAGRLRLPCAVDAPASAPAPLAERLGARRPRLAGARVAARPGGDRVDGGLATRHPRVLGRGHDRGQDALGAHRHRGRSPRPRNPGGQPGPAPRCGRRLPRGLHRCAVHRRCGVALARGARRRPRAAGGRPRARARRARARGGCRGARTDSTGAPRRRRPFDRSDDGADGSSPIPRERKPGACPRRTARRRGRRDGRR